MGLDGGQSAIEPKRASANRSEKKVEEKAEGGTEGRKGSSSSYLIPANSFGRATAVVAVAVDMR